MTQTTGQDDVQPSTIELKAIELCKHSLRMTSASGSGHPSSAMSLAHLVAALMYHHMRYDLLDPWNLANDRLVLSEGHAVPVVYAAYADLGGVVGKGPEDARPLRVEDLDGLRELDSVLDGHPNPAEGFPFFDAATGSLGQGLSVAAGLALAARADGIERRIYVIIGDGESREGQIWEAVDFVVDHKLTSVCAIFNCNGHGQAASVSKQQSPEVLAAKLAAFGWEAVEIDGHDSAAVLKALARASAATEKPLAIIARTVKGWGVDFMVGKNYHGKPLSPEDLDRACAELDAKATKDASGIEREITIRPHAPGVSKKASTRGPIKLPPFTDAMERAGASKALEKGQLATRAAFGVALVALGDADDRVVSLDADVSNSTYSDRFATRHPDRFFECKIAEQNMISTAAGLSAAGKIPFASTFCKFLARAADQIDLATISRANIKIIGSHSGVSLGADGPSQMSLSDLAYFRSMTRVKTGPDTEACHVFHPADAVCAYRCCELMAGINGLCFMRTHRPEAPFLYEFDETFEVGGCKQLSEGGDLTLVSSGFMLHTVLQVADRLAEEGISCNVFDVYTLPLDAEPILSAARSTHGVILTVEDNYVGGVRSELAEAAAEVGEVRVVGMTVERMPKSAKTVGEVFSYVGVGEDQIVAKAKELARG